MEREKMEIAKTLLECLEMIEDPRASYKKTSFYGYYDNCNPFGNQWC